jgi:hypothetical protein
MKLGHRSLALAAAVLALVVSSGCGREESKYYVGGTITGLTSAGLVLTMSGQVLPVASGATSFQFPGPIASGVGYAVLVSTQPANLVCNVTNGAGSITEFDVTNVQVTCTD